VLYYFSMHQYQDDKVRSPMVKYFYDENGRLKGSYELTIDNYAMFYRNTVIVL
jgi:hypothetical protein